MKAMIKKSTASAPFSFSFIDDAGKTVLKSENYKTKDSTKKGIRAVKANCTNEKRYVLKQSSNGMYFFNIKSANGQVVATSVMYPTEQEREEIREHIKNLIPDCVVEE